MTVTSETSQVSHRVRRPYGNGMTTNVRRNARIITFAKQKGRKWSYQLIADHFGVSRHVVAGVLFRERHPVDDRYAAGGNHNKIGGGQRPIPYYPEMTAQNTR